MMLGQAWINKESGYEVYSGYNRQGTDIMGKGSSGGPQFVYENGKPTIIGVKSAGTDTSSFWADIGLHYEELMQLIAGNDAMLPLSGTVPWPWTSVLARPQAVPIGFISPRSTAPPRHCRAELLDQRDGQGHVTWRGGHLPHQKSRVHRNLRQRTEQRSTAHRVL